jgi:hypothetical protein
VPLINIFIEKRNEKSINETGKNEKPTVSKKKI